MTGRIFFCAENVRVSSDAVTVDGRAFPLRELDGARTRRIGRWFWECHEVILSTRRKEEILLLRHRNAYFSYQLARAIEAAVAEQRAADDVAVLSA